MKYDRHPTTTTAETALSFVIGDHVTVVRDLGRGPIERDWRVEDLVYSKEGVLTHYIVIKPAEGGGVYEKTVPAAKLLEWNTTKETTEGPEEIGEDYVDNGPIEPQLAHVALTGSELLGNDTDVAMEIANLERAIRDSLENKKQAQLAGDGDASIYFGQQAGEYTLQLKALKSKAVNKNIF